MPQQALPWLLQRSVFVFNKYLAKNTGTTAHQNNYHKSYNNPICNFGERCLADAKYLLNYKPRQRNLDQKIIWIGKDPTTEEHLIALPPQYDNHASVTTNTYKCRSVTRLPKPNMWAATFLATVQWLRMQAADYTEPDISENYCHLLEHNANTRQQLPPQRQAQPAPPEPPKQQRQPHRAQ